MERDLFKPIVSAEKSHHLYRRLAQGATHAAARRLMNEKFSEFIDIDRSFVREFQTAGFSARVFELALFSYLQECNLPLNRANSAPDFVTLGPDPVAIEVTTTNQTQGSEPDDLTYRALEREDIEEGNRSFIFQIGKALRRKLLHRDAQGRAYWEKPHVRNTPFVIAVGAFHEQHAQIHPMGPVGQYLYGRRAVINEGSPADTKFNTEAFRDHRWGEKTIPSGLFKQAEAAHLSGVLFSNAHTVSMFNRIGTERGYGAPKVSMCRVGTAYNRDPEAADPCLFAYVVGDRPANDLETFGEGLHLFLNPWAAIPMSPTALPGTTYHELLADGRFLSTFNGSLQPYSSKTLIFEGEHAELFARYHKLRFLDLVPPIGD
ncbi:hypothetical protein [Nonomuraea fuscirosea]|uniref:hypothetical protein n=1 Tax=Nonomuraea fuscirosea TaxID=1291556 RepID=UPI00343941BD